MAQLGRNEIKRQLKKWEIEFHCQHNRKPLKEDIRAAPEHVRLLYKQYSSSKADANPWEVKFTPPVPAKVSSPAKGSSDSASERIAKKLLANLKENLPSPEQVHRRRSQKSSRTDLEPLSIEPRVQPPDKAVESSGHSVPLLLPRATTVARRSGTFMNRKIPLHFLETHAETKSTRTGSSENLDDSCSVEKAKSNWRSPSEDLDNSCSVEKAKSTRRSPCENLDDSCSFEKAKSTRRGRSEDLDDSGSVEKAKSTRRWPNEDFNDSGSFEKAKSTRRWLNEDLDDSGSVSKVKSTAFEEPNDLRLSPQKEARGEGEKRSDNSALNSQSGKQLSPNVLPSQKKVTERSFSILDVSTPSTAPVAAVEAPPATKKRPKRPKAAEPAADSPEAKRVRPAPSGGGAGGNFVKLNLRVKRFSRKGMLKQRQARLALRKRKWRKKFSGKAQESSACFICGHEGHWAKKCPGRFGRARKTDGEPAQVAEAAVAPRPVDVERLEAGAVLGAAFETPDAPSQPPAPLFDGPDGWEAGGGERVVTETLRSRFRLKKFRPGQLEAIQRVLSGRSCLLMMPTGGGKSLCYQLPAALLQKARPGSVVLVVSPLIALMEDQLSHLPAGLAAAHLNSSLSQEKREQLLAEAREGKFAFLLVSPEALVEQGRFSSPEALPRISFVCIDEVHCLADWSHHFRPSYLRVISVLRSVFGVTSFLGLTATCTARTMTRLAHSLGVEPDGCLRSAPLPPNLLLTASRDPNKEEALVELLRSPRFREARAVIVYCGSRDLTERVASYVRTALRGESGWSAEAYHAGLTTAQRARLQRQFLRGKLRVLVATIAFGMGLDKSDVDAVLHFDAPKSFENFVQEVGRAGRDGAAASCHVFLDHASNVLNELKRHIYANSVDRVALKRLLRAVFKPCSCEAAACRGHLRAISIEGMTQMMNVREETVGTILCYLAVLPESLVSLERSVMRLCTFSCAKGSQALNKASHRSLALATALKTSGDFEGVACSLEVDLVQLCERFGWSFPAVRKEFSGLEWRQEADGPRRTGLRVEFGDKAWLVRARGTLSDDAFDRVMDALLERLEQVEKEAVANLSGLHRALNRVAFPTAGETLEAAQPALQQRNARLNGDLCDFFDDTAAAAGPDEPASYLPAFEADVRGHIRAFISIYKHEHRLTGRVIACILHGIGTPLFPAVIWGKVRRFWRSQFSVDWPTLRKWATHELVGQ